MYIGTRFIILIFFFLHMAGGRNCPWNLFLLFLSTQQEASFATKWGICDWVWTNGIWAKNDILHFLAWTLEPPIKPSMISFPFASWMKMTRFQMMVGQHDDRACIPEWLHRAVFLSPLMCIGQQLEWSISWALEVVSTIVGVSYPS